MKIVECIGGRFKLSDCDYDEISKLPWQIMTTANGKKYARRTAYDPVTKRQHTELLHRRLMSNPSGLQIDHINGDSLDNRRENLRVVTISQQRMNSGIRKNKFRSKFKGVSYHVRDKAFVSAVCLNGSPIFRKEYVDETVAAWMYDIVSELLFGEYACNNFGMNSAMRCVECR